ncbi:MAG TPA: TetR/AcrR family transcriptional regulator [candidate division Zixibacteria bacterium]|nr:TetR/AcrR family transcriptional regulator [candidate division Zixibacteria bacterium]
MNSNTEEAAGKKTSHQAKLTQLLGLAARLIAREGYQKASIRKVAAAAGVSVSSPYHYFQKKEELLFQIQYRAFDSLVRGLLEELKGETSPERKLYLMIKNHVEYFLAHMDELKVCSKELESLSGAYYRNVLARRREYFDLTLKIVGELQKEYHNPAVDSRLATLSLFGMLNWIYMWYRPNRDNSKKIAEQMHRFILSGIGPSRVRQASESRKECQHV